jgi:GNAT superfamily N-acetyltransferase
VDAWQVKIRAMQGSDAAAVTALSGELGYPASSGEIERRIADVGPREDGALFVAESEDGEVVGWLHVLGRHLLESEPSAEIGGLVVGAKARRKGAGRGLVDAAEAWAREHAYRKMSLRSNTVRVEARPFYESRGYRVTKTQYKFSKDLD